MTQYTAVKNALFPGVVPNVKATVCTAVPSPMVVPVINPPKRYPLFSLPHFRNVIPQSNTAAMLNLAAVINHEEIMPEICSPCFNSTLIEQFLYKIPGLSEHFLYANDDMFLNKPITFNTFFAADGYPIIRLYRKPFRKLCWLWREQIRKKPLNNYRLEIKNADKLVEKKYGVYYNGLPHHNIDAYLRSDCQRVVEEIFKTEMEAMRTCHMRSKENIQRVIFSYVALAENHGHLRYVSKRSSQHLAIHREKDYERLRRYNPLFFCMNDSQYAKDCDRERAKNFLVSYYPNKSEFEK